MRQNELLGRRVAGRFTIKRFLGEGGMAKVYVAEQEAEPKVVALKVMNEELNADRTFLKRFQREAKAAARVQHPNSVHIIDYGVADGLSYIAMELLEGDDLYVLLERDGTLSQGRAVRILIEVCDALMVAHELGIVHRDLKPENIMIVADKAKLGQEHVKVLDFGIAKLLELDQGGPGEQLEQASAVTRAGTFIGTPAYMSPEQCALQPVDTRADIYTCGVLLFQLLTGRLPFEGQTPLHTATLHIHEPAPKPSTFAPAIDPRLEAIIMKALAKKPTDRHQTARHLASTLRKILPDLPDVQVAKVTRPPGSLRPVSVRAKGARNGENAAPEEAAMESAKTMVAHGSVGPPPSVLLHAGEAPEDDVNSERARIRPAPAGAVLAAGAPATAARLGAAPLRVPAPPLPITIDDMEPPDSPDSEDSARTLIRQPTDEEPRLRRAGPASEPPRKVGPKNTEVMAPGAIAADPSASALFKAPRIVEPAADEPEPVTDRKSEPFDVARARPTGRDAAVAAAPAAEREDATNAAAERSKVASPAAFAKTTEIDRSVAEAAKPAAAPDRTSAPGPEPKPVAEPPPPDAAQPPAFVSPVQTELALPPTPPIYPLAPAPKRAPATKPSAGPPIAGARGLLIGFLAGAVIMAIFAGVYALLTR